MASGKCREKYFSNIYFEYPRKTVPTIKKCLKYFKNIFWVQFKQVLKKKHKLFIFLQLQIIFIFSFYDFEVIQTPNLQSVQIAKFLPY